MECTPWEDVVIVAIVYFTGLACFLGLLWAIVRDGR